MGTTIVIKYCSEIILVAMISIWRFPLYVVIQWDRGFDQCIKVFICY